MDNTNFLSKQQVKVILQNAPKGTDPAKIVDALTAKGYKLEGFNDQPTPAPKPNGIDRAKTAITDAGSTINDAISGTGTFQGKPAVQRGVEAAATAASAPLNAAISAAPAPVKKGVDFVGNSFGTGIQKLGDLIGGIPTLQEFVTKHPEAAKFIDAAAGTAKGVGDVANNILAAEGGSKVGTKASKIADSAQNMLPKPSTVFDGGSFENNLNKAFPVLKKDAANLPAHYNKAQTAFTDIVKNKDTLGLVDDAGNPRLPKDFTETVAAQKQRLGDIYKQYTDKLSGVDAPKFETDVQSGIKSTINELKSQLKKENSIDGRKALTKIQSELTGLRDLSPEGIQNYIESINQRVSTAPGTPMTLEQAKLANLAGKMRGILDTSIEKLDGPGYQELRNTYSAHKALQDQMLRASAKELRNTPGLFEKASNVGLTVEGLNYLLTQNPAALVTGLGFKATTEFMKWLKSPQRALNNIYKQIDGHLVNDLPESPQTTINSATNTNTPIKKLYNK
jgi:hypothetical protein